MSNKKYHNKEWLKNQYFELNKDGMQIADEQNVHFSTIYDWMEKHGIDRRSKSEAKMGERNPHYKEHRPEHSERMSGSKNPSWKDGRTNNMDFRKQTKWKNFSKKLREKANWTCENCGAHGSEKEIQTHHAIPVSKGGDKFDNIFIVLCKECHGNGESFWHNNSVDKQLKKIDSEQTLGSL